MTRQKIVVICGPTASGKTGLALQLAKALPKANILSVDSRQVYQELDIVTGKDLPRDLPQNISFFGIDIFKPTEVANIGVFSRYAEQVIRNSSLSNTPLIIVGGTGLYLKSITESLSDISVPPNPELRKTLEQLPIVKLQEKLKKVNLKRFLSLNHSDLMNPRRLIRAIEISLSQTTSASPKQPQKYTDFFWIGLLPDKDTLRENIRLRVINRLEQGAVEEVTKLLAKYSDHSLPIFSSLGVPQIRQYIDKKISREELINIWTTAEIDYARRQLVWFKKQPRIVWYDNNIDKKKLVDEMQKIYKNHA